MAILVERRGLGDDLVRRVVGEEYPALCAAAEESGRSVPGSVARAVERFLACGDVRAGFAWLTCEDCGVHRLVPFSCKVRALCSSCGGRRMATRAARLVDRVLPAVPTRQWVLTFPWRRRLLLARRPEVLRVVVGAALEEVFAWLRERAAVESKASAEDAEAFRTGAVTMIQRFGSSLALNPHVHALIPDGAWARRGGGSLAFVPVKPPADEDVEALVVQIEERCEQVLARLGYGAEDEHEDPDPEDAQALLQAASLAGVAALGRRAGRRVRREETHGGRAVRLPPRCAVCEGYNLHAGVRVAGRDRAGLERLCRYIARPPLGRARLEEQPDGTILLRLKTPWSDGTAAIRLTRAELVERLLALLPPPRKNDILFHGVFAGHAAWRTEIVPTPDPDRTPEHLHLRLTKAPTPSPSPSWIPWAALLWRVFEKNGVACPRCGLPMRLRTVALPPATLAILAGLDDAAARAPPLVA